MNAMNALRFLLVFVCYMTVQSEKLPEFDDPIHGRLIVSRRNPPFLTLKSHPEFAHYVPTDQQVEQIRGAVYGETRFKRSSYNYTAAIPAKLRLKRDLGQYSMTDNDEMNEETGDSPMLPNDFEDGMKTFSLYTVFVGKLIIGMFKGYLGRDPIAPSDLPFAKFDDKTYFKAVVVDVSRMTLWLKDLRDSLEKHQAERPYFPIPKVWSELKECRNTGYTEVSDNDFKFKTESGGSMTYYKVNCMRMKKNIFVFLALHDNDFTLKPGELQRNVVGSVTERVCSFLCFISKYSTKFYTNTETVEVARHLSAAQQAELSTYLIERVIHRINTDFKDKIDAANEA